MKFERELENKRNKRNKKPFSENVHFVLCLIVMCLLFVVSVSLSIIDKRFCIVQYPDEFDNVMGISSQIITAVIALVVSIIGIAISLQNEECFGIKLTKLYSLRVENHFSILEIIIISILLCIFNMAFYMLKLYIAGIGIFVIAIVFLIQVVLSEVPIMSKTEKTLLKILINNLRDCYFKDKEASKDLKDAVRYLLYNKNLKEVYDIFKTPGDDEYNTYLIIKLLEYQHDLAFEINIKYDEKEQRNIASSLLDNVVDVILRHIDISNEAYSTICKNKYLITRVLFRI